MLIWAGLIALGVLVAGTTTLLVLQLRNGALVEAGVLDGDGGLDCEAFEEVELVEGQKGAEISLDDVLLVADGDNIRIGQPTLKGAKVTAEVVDPDKKAKKVIAFKFHRREGYHRQRGIRAHHTVLGHPQRQIHHRHRHRHASQNPFGAALAATVAPGAFGGGIDLLIADPFQAVLATLQRSHNVLITTHVRPDGDALGTAAAMAMGLRQAGIGAACIELDRGIDIAAGELMAALQPVVEAVERQLSGFDLGGIAGDGDAVAAAGEPDTQSLFESYEVPVMIAEQLR